MTDGTILPAALRTTLQSELDPFNAIIFGHDTLEEYLEALSFLSYDHIQMPYLILQPADDPLHSVNPAS